MTDSPWQESPSGISATMKPQGSQNDGVPWLVFHGPPAAVKRDIIEAFGWDATEYEDASPVAVFLGAVASYREAYASVARSGGSVWAGRGKGKSSSTDSASVASGDPWAEDDSKPAEPERNPLLDAIEASTTVDALKRLWAENKAEFDSNDELMATWKAKGKALSGNA